MARISTVMIHARWTFGIVRQTRGVTSSTNPGNVIRGVNDAGDSQKQP